ncbi:hypothetical protein SS1G_05311 [Sclerotinia sclerotiorum 1980 UF-70]|uniref:Transaldolase n=1 Tax=Sclerotinia sclerotiorum (strain ATCC 18683 / 1980 / Ss-1) TaxID=665079 RepID=A7EJ18_SCLS1|nr:hypothetical protein SS1G_05311 [Sclerotinia sclerotiorum 1980 UF-70]EDO02834.1 hypothetical protein SS1G_05311 [Sclerotinia sclerotiorum 1980 UF-70]
MAPQNLLELLRSRTVVDCDTMEFEVAKTLGPFTDCTSNQAIAFFELQKPENKSLLQETVETAKKLFNTGVFSNIQYSELAVEIAMVKLQLAIASVVTGFVHVQTNPYHSFTDTNKAHKLCHETQQFYRKNNLKTKVLPASLTNIDEIMMLAGVDHITIAPALLRELAATSVEGYTVKSLFDEVEKEELKYELREYAELESEWRIAFTRSGKGEGERKLSQAINIFCDMQTKLEAIFEELKI